MLRERAINGRLIFALVCASLGVIALLPASAVATFPGGNGKIAFHTDRDGNYEIYAMNADGIEPDAAHEQRRPTSEPGLVARRHQDRLPSDRDGNGEIYTMNADGIGQTRITNNPVDDVEPAWSPDGTKIAFATQPRRQLRDLHDERRRHRPTRLTNNPANDRPARPGRPTGPRSPSDTTATATSRSTR